MATDYAVQADGWARALAVFIPALPPTARDARDLAEYLDDVVAALVNGLVETALLGRAKTQYHARKALQAWATSRRGLPVDATDEEEDNYNARLLAKHHPDAGPELEQYSATDTPGEDGWRRFSYTFPTREKEDD